MRGRVNRPIRGPQLSNLYRAKILPQPRPCRITGLLRNPLQKQRQNTEKYMRLDPVLGPVEYRPNLDRRFHCLPRLFYAHKLLVSQSEVLGAELFVIGMDHPQAISLLSFPERSLTHAKLPTLQAAKQG